MKLNDAVEKFIENITVTDKQTTVIDGAFNNIESKLKDDKSSLSVKEVFLNGSYVRDTMIRPLDDIDIFAVIDKYDYTDNNERPNPQSVLTKFKNYLNGLSDYKDKVSQDRPCVTISLDKIHIDVLPALREHGILYIPNESLDGWTFTDPISHTANLDTVNDNSGGKVKDVVKGVKSWKRQKDLKIPSFHIEEVAMDIFPYSMIPNIEEGLRKWFSSAHLYLKKDRFNTSNQYEAAVSAVKKVSALLKEAKEKVDNQKEAEAVKIWHDIFGKDFPLLSEDDAKRMSSLLSNGGLKYGATTGLSSITGHAVAASKGFYGEE